MTIGRTTEQVGHEHCPTCSHCIPVHGDVVLPQGFQCLQCPGGTCIPLTADLSVLRAMVYGDNVRAAFATYGA